jgi:dihydroneopterin aldolase
MDEEEKIGSDYIVNLTVAADLERCSKSDRLLDTVDYVALHNIVKEEMKIRSKLLEHVAERILLRVMKEHASVKKATVMVSKRNPPIGGNVEEVAVKRVQKRSTLDLD